MVFSSAIFLFVFLPAVFLLYRLIPSHTGKNILLACSSIVFYAFGQLVYVPLFLASILINYLSGLLLMRLCRSRRLVLALSVLFNIGILCVFKYTDFIIENLNRVFSVNIPSSGIILPIGISFFTFQGLSYTIDVYRKNDDGTTNFLKLLVYISFFPQLIAGPIVKYHDISAQIDERRCTPEETALGVRRFLRGLSKKILLANPIGLIADRVFNDYLPNGIHDWRLMWLGAICYTLQIYYDFSGYSDMAIGLGHMFGFTFNENFLYPYGSSSLKEFWRRWHISLSSWFKEYLYIPLGGNRKGKIRTIFNKMVVFFCTGIWHGANWTFVLWGFGHGLLSSLEDLDVIPVKKLNAHRAGRIFSKFYTLFAVMLLFVIFRADSIPDAFSLIRYMFSGSADLYGMYLFKSLLNPAACTILLIALLFAGNLPRYMRSVIGDGMFERNQGIVNLFYLFLYILCIMSLARGGFNPFIYFQF